MKQSKHIIWDWNGTIVNDTWLFVELMNQVLKTRNLDRIDKTDYKNLFCFPLETYYQRLGFDFKKEPYEIPSMEFIKLYDKNKYDPLLFNGIKEILSLVKSLNSYNYLLSAQNQDSLIELVDFYKISSYFSSINGTDNFHARGKNALAKKILKKISTSSNNVIFIGDTTMDAEMALENQCKIIAITYGHHSANRFDSDKNILLVNSIYELKTCLLSLLLENP